MKYLNLNLTEELAHLLLLNSQMSIYVRWLNGGTKNVGHEFVIHILSETSIACSAISEMLIHGGSSNLLIEYCNELLSLLKDRLDEPSLSQLHDIVIPNAQEALESIINKVTVQITE